MTIYSLTIWTLLLSSCVDLNKIESKETSNIVKGPISLDACTSLIRSADISRPKGVYTSFVTENIFTNSEIVNEIQGGLIRVTWADLEPEKLSSNDPLSTIRLNTSKIEEKLDLLPQGKKWTLSIHGGWVDVDQDDPDLYTTLPNGDVRASIALQMSPSWLLNEGIETFDMEFRGILVKMPKYWDPIIQKRLKIMLNAIAEIYRDDPNLQLVYVPQMTSNGVEGHFNGVPYETLLSAASLDPNLEGSYDAFENLWVDSAIQTIESVSCAFYNKAVAFEVHDVLGRTNVADRIMNETLTNEKMIGKVGIAMWWISGGTDYQGELVSLLQEYPGDLYGQVIGNSSQPERFPNNDYSKVFEQAQILGMRYIEPWNYEFENNTFNQSMIDFNQYAFENYSD